MKKRLLILLSVAAVLLISAVVTRNYQYYNNLDRGYLQPAPSDSRNQYYNPNTYNYDVNYSYQQTQKSDFDLKAKIQKMLEGYGKVRNLTDMTIQVINGVVYLSGVVDSDKDIREIQNRVQKVSGVQGIDNQLEVRGQFQNYNRSYYNRPDYQRPY